MGRPGDIHVSADAALFPAGGWRPKESRVAICGPAERLVICLAALAVSRGSFTSDRAEVRELRATPASCAPSNLSSSLAAICRKCVQATVYSAASGRSAQLTHLRSIRGKRPAAHCQGRQTGRQALCSSTKATRDYPGRKPPPGKRAATAETLISPGRPMAVVPADPPRSQSSLATTRHGSSRLARAEARHEGYTLGLLLPDAQRRHPAQARRKYVWLGGGCCRDREVRSGLWGGGEDIEIHNMCLLTRHMQTRNARVAV